MKFYGILEKYTLCKLFFLFPYSFFEQVTFWQKLKECLLYIIIQPDLWCSIGSYGGISEFIINFLCKSIGKLQSSVCHTLICNKLTIVSSFMYILRCIFFQSNKNFSILPPNFNKVYSFLFLIRFLYPLGLFQLLFSAIISVSSKLLVALDPSRFRKSR